MLYETLKREVLNWRKLNLEVGLQVYKNHQLQRRKKKAFVVDDSVRQLWCKKMEGVSKHFVNETGRCMGQQVLTLGLATGDAFLPILSPIYISSVKAQGLKKPFKDGLSRVTNR